MVMKIQKKAATVKIRKVFTVAYSFSFLK